MSACVGPDRIMNAWPPSRGEAIHTSTFLGNPLSCAAGLAFLEELVKGDLVARSRTMGERLLSGLQEVTADIPQVAEVRGRGLLVGVDLRDPESGTALKGAGARIATQALREGILILAAGPKGNVLELSPPLVITEDQIDWAISRLGKLIGEGLAQPAD